MRSSCGARRAEGFLPSTQVDGAIIARQFIGFAPGEVLGAEKEGSMT